MPSKTAFSDAAWWGIIAGWILGMAAAFTTTAHADTVPLGIVPGAGADTNSANTLVVTGPFTALTSGTVNRIAMYTTGGTTQMTYGLYADTGGTMAAGSPLCTTAGAHPAAGGGWCIGTLNGSGTCAIVSGTKYWFGASWSGSVSYKHTSQTNGMYYKTVMYSGGTLPTVPTGMTTYPELISMLAFVGPSIAPPTSAVLATSGGTLEGVAYTGTFAPAPTSNYVGTYGAGAGTAGTLTGSYSGGTAFSLPGSNVNSAIGIYPSGSGTTTASASLSTSLYLTSGTLFGVGGAYNASNLVISKVSSGTTYGPLLSLTGTDVGAAFNTSPGTANVLTGHTWSFLGVTYSGSAAGGTPITVGGLSISPTALSLTGGTAQLTGSLTGSCSGTLFSSTGSLNLVGSNTLTLAGSGTFTIGNGAAQTPSYVTVPANSALHTGSGYYGPGSSLDGNYYYQSLDALHVRKGTQWGVGNGQTGQYVKPAGGQ